MIPTIDATKGAILTMNVIDEDDEDLDDEMAEDVEHHDDDFWMGKLGDLLHPADSHNTSQASKATTAPKHRSDLSFHLKDEVDIKVESAEPEVILKEVTRPVSIHPIYLYLSLSLSLYIYIYIYNMAHGPAEKPLGVGWLTSRPVEPEKGVCVGPPRFLLKSIPPSYGKTCRSKKNGSPLFF